MTTVTVGKPPAINGDASVDIEGIVSRPAAVLIASRLI